MERVSGHRWHLGDGRDWRRTGGRERKGARRERVTGALDEEVKGRGDNKSLGVEQVYNRVWTRVRWVSLGVLGGFPIMQITRRPWRAACLRSRKNHAQK